jgi:integrase
MSIKKRGQNEGSIYFHNKSKSWCAQISLEGKRISKYFKIKTEARAWIKETLDQIDNGLTFKGANSTVKQFLSEWIIAVTPNLAPTSARDYASYINRHINPYLGKIKLSELRPDHVQTFYNRLSQKGCTQSTIRIVHAVLHKSLNQAVRWGLIGRNPASLVEKPKPKKKEMKTWNNLQVMSFLSVIQDPKYQALFYLAVTTGMRQGELLGLMWEDLDWITGYIQVKRQLQRITGYGKVLRKPKTASGQRMIVLGQTALDMLKENKENQFKLKNFAGEKWEENDFIFTSNKGTGIEPRRMYLMFKKYSAKANLPSIRLHDLRHTAATLMLQENVHPKIVQERLGHSDITLTLNTYSHVTPVMQSDVAEKLDILLKPILVSNQA